MMEWDNNQDHHQQQQQENQQQRDNNISSCRSNGNNNNNNNNSTSNGGGGGGMLYVKVMTDEQLETLRKQIAVYATICEQLVQMHKTLSAHQDLAGGRLPYCDPLMASAGHKITARQRWTPTPIQLQILERIFDQGNGTPSKQKIKEITSELSQHGQISETNVYNWFQNRRARSKRKQILASSNNAESEPDTEVDSLHENNTPTKPEIFHNPPDLCFHTPPELSSDLHFLGDDHLTGKMGAAGGYDLYGQGDDYGIAG